MLVVTIRTSMGLVIVLYVAMIVSFCFPHVVDVSALSICIVLRAFVVISRYLLYVSLGSEVSPSIFGLMFMGSEMLSIFSSSCVLYSAGSGVHVCISCRYDRMFAFAMFMSWCVDGMVMAYA